MRKRFVERLEGMRGQTGFTLLELIATVLVLSILLAIAGNYYYHQRKKAWVAQVHASLRHMTGAENNFVYTLGAAAYTNDLDDLWDSGYRWRTDSVIPYVALATNETFCIQVHSAHDPTIVWHFSSEVGRQQKGPATPEDCGDPEVLGTYIAGPPPETYGRDGHSSGLGGSGASVASLDPGADAGREGDGSGSFDGGGESGSGAGDRSGSTDPGGSGTNTGETIGSGSAVGTAGDSGTGTDGTTSTCGGSTSGGSSGVSNHPSGKDRDTENGNSGDQGKSGSDPDGDENGGADKPGQGGGANTGDQDGNNGSGNDSDFEDDNRGPNRDGSNTPGTSC